MRRELRVSLREHFDELLAEREKRLDERWRAQQDALLKALTQLDARLELLNELREGILTRKEYQSAHDNLVTQIESLRERISDSRGERRGTAAAIATVIAILGVLATFAVVIGPHIH